jgi:hypothetical protein
LEQGTICLAANRINGEDAVGETSPQLVTRLRSAQQQLLEIQQQRAALVEVRLKQETTIAELEAKLAALEPYRTFVEQIRQRIRHEEHGKSTLDTWLR